MNTPEQKQIRTIFSILLVVTGAIMMARLVNAELLVEPSLYKQNPSRKWPASAPGAWPTFSSNDRVRWATVRSLAENNTFEIGQRIEDPTTPKGYRDEGILFEDGFKSVDAVLHPDRKVFYGTKTPLLVMMAAGEYKIILKYCNIRMAEKPWHVVIPILTTLHILPLLLALFLLGRLICSWAISDWGKIFTFSSACFGTFLTTFAMTFNNHVPAACCLFYVVYLLFAPDTTWSVGRLFLAGLLAGLATAFDYPMAALGGCIFAVLLLTRWKTSLLFLLAMLVFPAIQTVINYKAYGIYEPIYSKFGTAWYEYEGSHWNKVNLTPPPTGIDFLNQPKHIYAVNLTFGHHGLFSLTPVFLIGLIGLFFAPKWLSREQKYLWWTSIPMILAVIGYFVATTNNYAGWSCGPRWLFGLIPSLLLGLVRASDYLGSKCILRWTAYVCLGLSIFAAQYCAFNPWRYPWLLQWSQYQGLTNY